MGNQSQNHPSRHTHRLKPEVYANTGYEFHFTICARHQKSPFSNERLAKTVIDSLLLTRSQHNWVLFCYCLMPDHLHFLCRLTDREKRLVKAGVRGTLPEGVLDHVARFKSYATTESWKMGFTGQLWQKSSYDRVIDLEKPFEEVANYILENPVRKGLVRRWQDWQHSVIVDPWL